MATDTCQRMTTDLCAVDAAELAAVVVTPAVDGAGAAPRERPGNRGGGGGGGQ